MVFPSTFRDVKSDEDEDNWFALQGNTLSDLREPRIERCWVYARRKATTKRRIEKAILKRLQDRTEDPSGATEKTRWKPRLCQIHINPSRWGSSELVLSRNETAGSVKQRVRLADLSEVLKHALHPNEALVFPVTRPAARGGGGGAVSGLGSSVGAFNSPLASYSPPTLDSDDDDEGRGDGEFRYGHLVFSLQGAPPSDGGSPFYSEMCCASTKERDAWVQLFQDVMVLAEMEKLKNALTGPAASTALPMGFGSGMKKDVIKSYIDFFRSGAKSLAESSDDASITRVGHTPIDARPKGGLLIQLPLEEKPVVRNLTVCPDQPGWVKITKSVLGMSTSSFPLDLAGCKITASPHNFNSFQIGSDAHCIKVELKQKGENRKGRDDWIEWLLSVQAMAPMRQAILDGQWTKVIDKQTSLPCYIETRPSAKNDPHGRGTPSPGPGRMSPSTTMLYTPTSASPMFSVLPGGFPSASFDTTPNFMYESLPRVAFAVFPTGIQWTHELAPTGELQIYRRIDGNPAAVIEIPDVVIQNWYGRPGWSEGMRIKSVHDLNEIYQDPKDDVYGYGRKLSGGVGDDASIRSGNFNTDQRDTAPEITYSHSRDWEPARKLETFDTVLRRPPKMPSPWEMFEVVTLPCTETRIVGGVHREFLDFILQSGSPISLWWTFPLPPNRNYFVDPHAGKPGLLLTEDMYESGSGEAMSSHGASSPERKKKRAMVSFRQDSESEVQDAPIEDEDLEEEEENGNQSSEGRDAPAGDAQRLKQQMQQKQLHPQPHVEGSDVAHALRQVPPPKLPPLVQPKFSVDGNPSPAEGQRGGDHTLTESAVLAAMSRIPQYGARLGEGSPNGSMASQGDHRSGARLPHHQQEQAGRREPAARDSKEGGFSMSFADSAASSFNPKRHSGSIPGLTSSSAMGELTTPLMLGLPDAPTSLSDFMWHGGGNTQQPGGTPVGRGERGSRLFSYASSRGNSPTAQHPLLWSRHEAFGWGAVSTPTGGSPVNPQSSPLFVVSPKSPKTPKAKRSTRERHQQAAGGESAQTPGGGKVAESPAADMGHHRPKKGGASPSGGNAASPGGRAGGGGGGGSKRGYKRCWCSIEKRDIVDSGKAVRKVVMIVSKVDSKGVQTEDVVPAEEIEGVASAPESGSGFGFCVGCLGGKEYQFYAQSDEERAKWIATLQSVIKKSRARSARGLAQGNSKQAALAAKQVRLSSESPSHSPASDSARLRHARDLLLSAGDALPQAARYSPTNPLSLDLSRALLSGSPPPASAFPLASPQSPTRQLPIPRSLNPGSPSFRNMRTVL